MILMKRTYMHEYHNTRNTRIIQQQELRRTRRLELLHKLRTNTVAAHSSLPNYENIKNGILSLNLRVVYDSVYQFRQILCRTEAPPIQEMVQTHLVPRFVELLSLNNILYTDAKEKALINSCRTEAAWVLTNIASGDTQQTSTIIENGGIPLLFKMLNENDDIADQAIWCLSNIAGDKEVFRDNILHFPKSLELLFDLYKRNNANLTKNVTWLLSNLCRGKNPVIEHKKAAIIIKVFTNLLKSNDTDVVHDVIWGISYIIDGNFKVIDKELITYLYSLLTQLCDLKGTESTNVPRNLTAPLIRCIGSACVVSDDVMTFLMSNSLLGVLKSLFFKISAPKLRREICWIISNVSLSYDITEAYEVLFYVLDNCERSIQIEALYALMNLEDNTIYDKILKHMINLSNHSEELNDEIVKCVERNCARDAINISLSKSSKILDFISSERSEQVKLRFDL